MNHRRFWGTPFSATAAFALGLLGLVASAYGDSSPATPHPGRWYTNGLAERGRALYAEHCAVCHGSGGAGDGPAAELGPAPPPLDGQGHSSHHGLDELLETVAKGGASHGARMPAFEEILDDAQRRAVVAYVQSLWPDSVYQGWAARNQMSHNHTATSNQ